jgi:hypothetical protein
MKKTSMHIHAFLCILCLILFSCDGSSIVTGEEDLNTIRETDTIDNLAIKQEKQRTPVEETEALIEMIEEIRNLNRQEFTSLNEEELLDFGEPLRLAFDGTRNIDEETLRLLNNPLQILTKNVDKITREEHKELSKEIENLLHPTSDFVYEERRLTSEQIKELLVIIHESEEESEMFHSLANQFYNTTSSCVVLTQGDNFNTANSFFPPYTTFCVDSGNHYAQVSNPKTGNQWIGFTDAVMYGMYPTPFFSLNYAFTGTMNNNSFHFLEIRNYRSYGINSNDGNNVLVQNMVFINIANDRNGQTYGAIRFYDSVHINVNNSHFEDVASAVRFMYSNGPLLVTYNTALNPGRNFFQCNNCTGDNIRINHNSMEHNEQVASQPLEDFINIFESSGLSGNWIQVNYNRGRVNLVNGNASGVSNSGCLIILGDYGGIYQEAKNNIGVNPGNCGIGVAGGFHFKVEDNKMYSQQIDGISNTGFYAAAYPSTTPCYHNPDTFSNNQSSFICGRNEPPPGVNCGIGLNNWATAPETEYSDHYCGIRLDHIRDDERVLKNESLGPWIWETW